MNVLVKIKTTGLDPSLIVFFRGLIGVLLFTPFVKKEVFLLLKKRSLLLWCRFLAGSLSIFALFYNVQLSGAAAGTALSKLEAIFVILLSILIFRTIPKKLEWAGIILILAGVYIIYSPIIQSLAYNSISIGFLGAFFGGIALISLKKTAHVFSPFLIVWGLCFTAMFASFALPHTKGWQSIETIDIGILSLIGVIAAIGQIFLTKSYALLPAPIASMINLSTILWCLIFEMLFSQIIPKGLSLMGYGLMILGLILIQFLYYAPSLKPKPR
jgi:drug/metabolite transporter (DMT)-like permease